MHLGSLSAVRRIHWRTVSLGGYLQFHKHIWP